MAAGASTVAGMSEEPVTESTEPIRATRAEVVDRGGRLPLLPVHALDEEQRALHAELRATRLLAAKDAGYTAVLPDGRLLGPFNVMLRAPRIARPLLEWAQAITGSGLAADVREVVILTVAAHWRADYALYAHAAVAARAGVTEAAIAVLRAGGTPHGLCDEAATAHRVTVALVRDHRVPDDLYAKAAAVFGTEGLVALVNLVGQYLNTSALLALFEVPVPVLESAA